MVNKRFLSYTLILLCLGCCGGLVLYRLFDIGTRTNVIIPTERSQVSQVAPLPERSHTPSPTSEPTSTFTPAFSPTSIPATTAAPEVTATAMITSAAYLSAAICIPEGAQVDWASVTRVIDRRRYR